MDCGASHTYERCASRAVLLSARGVQGAGKVAVRYTQDRHQGPLVEFCKEKDHHGLCCVQARREVVGAGRSGVAVVLDQ